MTNRLYSFVIISLLITGCATGRTEFRVIQTTPHPTPVISTGQLSGPFSEKSLLDSSAEASDDEKTDSSLVKVYTVQKGDSLWFISETYLGDPKRYPELVKINQIVNPDLIFPGQQLQIKDSELKPVARLAKPKQDPKSKKETVVSVSTPIITAAKITIPDRVNNAFSPGEQLLFSVEYFGIAAGFATLSVKKGPLMHGRQTVHLVASARTHPAFEWIFKVRDTIESYIDEKGLFSWRYEKHLSEGNYKNDSVLIYDQLKQKVSKDEGRTIVDAPPWTQDVLSEFYFFRTLPLKVGQSISIPVVADNAKTYELVVKAVKKEKITVPAGTFECIKVEPFLKFEGLFKHQGQMHIWVTDDDRKVPVLIKSKIVIGSIDIVLRDAVVVDVK